MRSNRLTLILGSLAIVFATIFWGTAFAEQRLAAQYLTAFTLNAVRFLIGGVILIPCAAVSILLKKRSGAPEGLFKAVGGKRMVIGGILSGLAIFTAAYLQQRGLETTGAGKSGFMTALYIVLVPIFAIVLKKKTTLINWIGIAIAVVGMYLMCVDGPFTLEAGDVYLFGCACVFAVQILVLDVFSDGADPLTMSCVQELTCGLVGLIAAFLFEKPSMESITAAWQPVLFLGVFSCAVAYTLQVLGQKYVPAQAATLLMSLEAVFASIAGVILLKEYMSVREIIGAALMFAAVLLVELVKPAGKTTQQSRN